MAQLFGNEDAAKSEAGQLRTRANVRRAMGQRAGIEARREARYAMSAARARAAAQGADLSDPSLINNMARIESQGEYDALAMQFGAEDEARGDELAAWQVIQQGRQQDALGILNGIKTFYGMYG